VVVTKAIETMPCLHAVLVAIGLMPLLGTIYHYFKSDFVPWCTFGFVYFSSGNIATA
jgi:hypothetical protein